MWKTCAINENVPCDLDTFREQRQGSFTEWIKICYKISQIVSYFVIYFFVSLSVSVSGSVVLPISLPRAETGKYCRVTARSEINLEPSKSMRQIPSAPCLTIISHSKLSFPLWCSVPVWMAFTDFFFPSAGAQPYQAINYDSVCVLFS